MLTQMKPDASEDRALVFGLGGLLVGLFVVLIIKFAYPGVFDTPVSGPLSAIAILLGCGLLGTVGEQRLALGH